VVVGDKGLDEGKLEYKGRSDTELSFVPLQEISSFLAARLQQTTD
jgi:prolyl-tRNA synthetase